MNFCDLYEKSEIYAECQSLLSKISKKLDWFSQEYIKWDHRKEITQEELRSNINNKLSEMSELERLEYNEICKMLSQSNCWYAEYQVAQIIHEELIKIWYGK